MRRGLTLMELLVVMSILATLAALLYPVYLMVRSRMYAISCANQLRQIGLALHMYAQDQGDDSPYNLPFSLGKLYPNYVSDRNLLVCPYFQTLFPGVAEKCHEFYLKSRWREVWSSYWNIIPKDLDNEMKHGRMMGFSLLFAKRGGEVPIVFCDAHRLGCPETSHPYKFDEFKHYFIACIDYRLFDPRQPILILRWNGMVDFVYKAINPKIYPTEEVLYW